MGRLKGSPRLECLSLSCLGLPLPPRQALCSETLLLLRNPSLLLRNLVGAQDWDAALRCCSGPAQRDEVHRARAEAALAAGDYRTAAVHFAKVRCGLARGPARGLLGAHAVLLAGRRTPPKEAQR